MSDSEDLFSSGSQAMVLEDKTYKHDNLLETIYAGARQPAFTPSTKPQKFSYQYIPPQTREIVSGNWTGNEEDEEKENRVPVMSHCSSCKNTSCEYCNYLQGFERDLNSHSFQYDNAPCFSGVSVCAGASSSKKKDRTSQVKFDMVDEAREKINKHVQSKAHNIAGYIFKHFGKIPDLRADHFFKALDELKMTSMVIPEIQQLFIVTTGEYKKMLGGFKVTSINPLFNLTYDKLSFDERAKLTSLEDMMINSGYIEFMELSKNQSRLYFSPVNFIKMRVKQNSIWNIHPMFVALFGVKLPLIEHTCISGDTFSFLQQKLHRLNLLRSDNYELYINRMSDPMPIRILGVNGMLNNQLHTTQMHAMLRRIVFSMRLGNFESCYSDKLIAWLRRCIPSNYSTIMHEEELLWLSFMGLFGIKPTMIIYPTYNGPAIVTDIKVVPIVYANLNIPTFGGVVSSDGRFPFEIATSTISNLVVDNITNKLVYQQYGQPVQSPYGLAINTPLDQVDGISAMPMPIIQQLQNSMKIATPNRVVISNGVMIYYIPRKVDLMAGRFNCEPFGESRTYIYNYMAKIEQNLVVNGIYYTLRSAMCHRPTDTPLDALDLPHSDLTRVDGYVTYLYDENEWYKYDPLTFMFNTETRNLLFANDDSARMEDILKCDQNEVMDIISQTSIFLVYSQDFREYEMNQKAFFSFL